MPKKFLDAEGVSYLYSSLSLQDYPNNETLVSVINAIDENKANKKNAEFEGQPTAIINGKTEKLATESYFNTALLTRTDLVVNNTPSEPLPLASGTQFVCYCASSKGGTFHFIFDEEHSVDFTVSNSSETVWLMWIQTDLNAGSFISSITGQRYYKNLGYTASEVTVTFTPASEGYSEIYIVLQLT